MECAAEDVLNFAYFALSTLFIVGLVVVALDHGDDLVDVAAGDDFVTHTLLGLHTLLHHKFILLLLIDDTFADGLSWVFLVDLPQIVSILEQFFILLERLKTFIGVVELHLAYALLVQFACFLSLGQL